MKGILRIILLRTLQENPGKSGAALSRIIKDKIGREPSPGSLYPLLSDLGEKKIVEEEKKGKRKAYKLTEKGEEALEGIEEHRKEVIEKAIRGLKTYEYVFGEEEIEDIIESLKCMDKDSENLPEYLKRAHGIVTLLQEKKDILPEERTLEILKNTENKIKNLLEDQNE